MKKWLVTLYLTANIKTPFCKRLIKRKVFILVNYKTSIKKFNDFLIIAPFLLEAIFIFIKNGSIIYSLNPSLSLYNSTDS